MAHAFNLTLRVDVDELSGDQSVTLVVGGSTRGGTAEARWGFAGGLDTAIAEDIRREVMGTLGTLLSLYRPDGQMMLI